MRRSVSQQAVAISEHEQKLWTLFKQNGSTRLREQLFIHYTPLARQLAARHFRKDALTPIEFEELFQFASVGLLEAIDRFQPELGVPFRYFGSRRISGSILTGMAKHSEVNEQISFRRRIARERLSSIKPSQIDTKDINAALEILGEIASGLALGLMFDSVHQQVDHRIDPGNGAYETVTWRLALTLLTRELDQLPERDAGMIRLHYFEGIAFNQIALALGISKGRVAQLHKAAIALLRKRLVKTNHFDFMG